MTNIDQRRRDIMRKLDERYYAHYARIDAQTADERALRLGQPTSYDLRMRGQLRYSAGRWVYHHAGNSDTAGSDYDYRQ
jgi:hypothetical protein